MKKQIELIKKGQDVRANLISCKECLKDESKIDEFLIDLDWNLDFFRELLTNNDAKVRKNCAQIIAICELDGLLPELFEAYQKEETLFVRPVYLKAMKDMDVSPYLSQLEQRQKQLMKQSGAQENEKHVVAELRELSSLLRQNGKGKNHKFIGAELISTMILTTVSGAENYLVHAVDRIIGEGKTKAVRGGVRVQTSAIEELMKVRCFQEMLFVIPGMNGLKGTQLELAKQVLEKGLLEYLQERLLGSGAFRFRMAVMGMKDADARQHFVKKMSEALEKESSHQLVNAPSDYEIELRFMYSVKTKTYSLYVKMMSIEDKRFSYREHSLATSIQPYVAALIMEMMGEETKGCGQILDPFCGVGTMLIERNFYEYAHSIYGVDIYGQGIQYGLEHAKRLHLPMHLVHKDMKDFTHEYPFELIVTDLPSETKGLSAENVQQLYDSFLRKCNDWLGEDGKIIAYTKSVGLFEQAIHHSNYKIVKQQELYRGKSKVFLLESK